MKGVIKTIKSKAKDGKGRFLSMLLGTLGVWLLGNLLSGKGVIATSQGRGIIRAGESTFRAGQGTIRAGQVF